MKHLKDDINLQKEMKTVREALFSLRSKFPKKVKEWADMPYGDMMYNFYHTMEQKKAEKWLEPWVAAQLKGRQMNKEDKRAFPKYTGDFGDLMIGDRLNLGVNNFELKASMDETEDKAIGGGQLRYYDNVAGYVFFQGKGPNKFELYYISKEEIIEMEKKRIENAGGLTCSQGTGIWSKDASKERLVEILQENVSGVSKNQLGFKFDKAVAQDYQYQTFEELSKKLNETI
jgi:hypothetical protein